MRMFKVVYRLASQSAAMLWPRVFLRDTFRPQSKGLNLAGTLLVALVAFLDNKVNATERWSLWRSIWLRSGSRHNGSLARASHLSRSAWCAANCSRSISTKTFRLSRRLLTKLLLITRFMKRTPIHHINIPQLKQSRFDTQKSRVRVTREIAAPFSSPAFWLTSNFAVA
jgi:hypothetical protein